MMVLTRITYEPGDVFEVEFCISFYDIKFIESLQKILFLTQLHCEYDRLFSFQPVHNTFNMRPVLNMRRDMESKLIIKIHSLSEVKKLYMFKSLCDSKYDWNGILLSRMESYYEEIEKKCQKI